MSKKYTLTLTEKQARLLSWACDTFPRLIEGQDWQFQELFETAWEKRCKEATGKFMSDDFEGGWHQMRERTEELVKQIKKDYWGLGACSLYGIHYDASADILWDIHQVIRHQLWLDNDNPNKSTITNDAFPATRVGEEPLCTIKLEEQK